MASDKELGLGRPISRRQFCQGSAVAIGASLLPWASASGFDGSPEIGPSYYPPSLTGLRGSAPGTFETAHALARGGKRWDEAAETGEAVFDLAVVGAGLSGLAAARTWQKSSPGDRILVLENHPDFGGHAVRNEFRLGDRTIIGYGGSQSIDTPSSFSSDSRALLDDLGVDLPFFYRAFDREFYASHSLQDAFWLDRTTFGVDRLVKGNPLYWRRGEMPAEDRQRFAAEITNSDADRDTLMRILAGAEDLMPGRTGTEKVALLRSLSYDDFLRRYYGASEYLVALVNPLPKGLWGCGTDCLSAREALNLTLPGFDGLGIDPERDDPYYAAEHDEPYIFHFPDGNAGLARLLVRKLVPEACPGETMHDQVRARVDYGALDRPGQRIRIRLNATVVDIRHEGGPASANAVRLRYVKAGEAHDVRAKRVVYAGYSAMLPHLAPEFPAAQAEGFSSLVKVPLLYANVLLRDWQSFARLGVERIRYPGGLFGDASLDFPVSMGGYEFSKSPKEPIVVHLTYVPTEPGSGLDARTQNRRGRHTMLRLGFEDYERAIRQQMGDSLSAGGFDPARDIAAITVNRWPHGYAYEYNDLYDPPEWNRWNGPHIEARRPFGRVAIANSDAEAFAYVNGSFDAAVRAVRELGG